jgi:type IV secretion system protein VirB9
LGGAKALRPSKIRDDGFYTYIEWPENAELPAVFSRGSDGSEVVAEGVMMGDDYVLDRVHSLLIFRIDRQAATASRRAKGHE